ncbi:MAG: 5-(carboxyamino)imidazole ribonucleotide synthase [Thiotrichales bacterium]
MILPGATLGMLGGGQLGRMFTIAARTMGYRVIVLDPDADSPAGRFADEHLHAAYTDTWALDELAGACAVVTTEFENIPASVLRRLAVGCPVRPSADAVETTQNRIREKRFIQAIGLLTSPFAVIESASDLAAAAAAVAFPAILKRAELGYDGKGQVVLVDPADLPAAFASLGGIPCVLEHKIDLVREISVVLARNEAGESRCYPVGENIHRDGILYRTQVPATVDTALAEAAAAAAKQLADALAYCGVMAVEFFVSRAGELLVNEIAPRPHNSGHFTLDACVSSQFEQQVRMICGLPFGDTRLLSPVAMVNLLGDLWRSGAPRWERLLVDPGVKLHLYGKLLARPGRKMGHFCLLRPTSESLGSDADGLFAQLR